MNQKKRKTYHHGNLQAEAVKAAYRLVEQGGHEKLSVRRVADTLGVAHRSLYNHFKDRGGLLDAVATCGFDNLAAAVAPAGTKAAFVNAYLDFALTHAAVYNLMMTRPHATMSERPVLQTAVHKTITKAMQFFAVPGATPAENRSAVMKAYMLLHGGITLKQTGILDLPNDEAFIDELKTMAAAL